VHESQTPGVQRSAVLSVLFNEGAAASSFLQPILDRLPGDSEARCGNGIKDDMLALPNGAVAREESMTALEIVTVFPMPADPTAKMPTAATELLTPKKCAIWVFGTQWAPTCAALLANSLIAVTELLMMLLVNSVMMATINQEMDVTTSA